MTTIKIVISLDSDLLGRVDALAEALELPRSRVLAQATEEYLCRRDSQRLLGRLDEVYGEAPSVEDEEVRERRRVLHRKLLQDASGDQTIRAATVEGRAARVPPKEERERRVMALHRLFELFQDHDAEAEVRRLKTEDHGS